MSSPSATQDRYPYQNEPIWSRSEKVIARTAFDAALGRELHEVIQEAKKRASQIQQSSDLWDLEHYLTQRRKEIDRKYEFRSSRLTHVLGHFSGKAGSERKSCEAWRKTSWNLSVLTLSSWRSRTRRDLGFERYRLVSPTITSLRGIPPQVLGAGCGCNAELPAELNLP
jgi:hypothetical protein